MKQGLLLFCLYLHVAVCVAQSNTAVPPDTTAADVTSAYNKLSTKSLDNINSKYSKLTGSIQKQSLKLLQRMQHRENKLQQQVQDKDSTAAQQVFSNSNQQYQALQQQLQSPIDKTISHPLKEYIPGIDSMQTSMQFLQQAGSKIPGLPLNKLQSIQGVSTEVQQLQARLQQANQVQQFVREREQQLKDNLSKYGFGKQLTGINKQVYYYQQQLTEYKSLLKDDQKLEQKALSLIRELPAFQSFMQKNSFLAQLFPMPENYGTAQALAGLQTRAQVQQQLEQRFGAAAVSTNGAGGGGQGMIDQQVQQAQGEISKLKDKINQLGGGSSDMTMPDFTPNNQKTKSFLKRLEYGFNIQSQQSSSFLPTTSDLALTLGYKLSDKASLGVGAGYKLGWGRGWNHMALSSQGVSLRSYIDIKAKGSIWITGGYEYNYQTEFKKFSELSNLDTWQKSALIGLTKKYKVGKKTGNMQLLYDLLAGQQIPRASAFKFRIGYSL